MGSRTRLDYNWFLKHPSDLEYGIFDDLQEPFDSTAYLHSIRYSLLENHDIVISRKEYRRKIDTQELESIQYSNQFMKVYYGR